MLRRFLEWWSSRQPPPRVIYDIDGTSPYLSRHYLIGLPRMPDGSWPFDARGDAREGVIWKSVVGLYLHRFHRGDNDRELHNHPWKWSVSLILAGGYREERRQGDIVVERVLRPGRLNWIGHDDFHRVDLIDGEAWTLFLAGPKVSTWGFWNRATGLFLHWRDFLASKRAERRAA